MSGFRLGTTSMFPDLSFDDEVLGRVTWAAGRCWTFEVGIGQKRVVPVTYVVDWGDYPP